MVQESQQEGFAILSCVQCGREGWKAIFTCPQRRSGDCPYVEEWRGKGLEWFGFILLVVLGVFLVVIALSAKTSLLLGLLVLLAAGLVIFGGICYICTVTIQLYNPGSGVRLQRTALWGIELSYRWITRAKPVPIDLELSQPLTYPPSVTALRVPMGQVVAIVRAALIGLLAKRHIQVYHSQIYEFKRWRGRSTVRDDYSIVATEQADRAWSGGELERRIRRFLAGWPARRWKEAKQRPEGPSISTLVAAIYDRGENNPEEWLTQLVAKKAAAQGWCQIKKPLWTHKWFVEWDGAHATQFQREQEIVKVLSNRLSELHPNLSLALDEEIKKGIDSRRFEPSDIGY